MKAIGIVRRVDNLGRVVVPKELRRSLGWDEDTPLEIFTIDGGVVFKKYRKENEQIENFRKRMENLLKDYKEATASEWETAARYRAFGYAMALMDACENSTTADEMESIWEIEYREQFGF